jgi:hypothetical protein
VPLKDRRERKKPPDPASPDAWTKANAPGSYLAPPEPTSRPREVSGKLNPAQLADGMWGAPASWWRDWNSQYKKPRLPKKTVRTRTGTRSTVEVPPTLEEYRDQLDREGAVPQRPPPPAVEAAPRGDPEAPLPSVPDETWLNNPRLIKRRVSEQADTLSALRDPECCGPPPEGEPPEWDLVGDFVSPQARQEASRGRHDLIERELWQPDRAEDAYDRLSDQMGWVRDIDDRSPWEIEHAAEIAEDEHREQAREAEAKRREREDAEVAALVKEWRTEIDQRVGTCENPNGCDRPIFSKGRCKRCYDYRYKNKAERPARLLERDRQRR